jgi:hypothetical protein
VRRASRAGRSWAGRAAGPGSPPPPGEAAAGPALSPVLRIRDFTHLGSRIPDLGSRIQKQEQKRRVDKKIVVILFFCSHNFHKFVNYFILVMLKKKIWANFQRIIELFTKKSVTKLSKIWVWDPGSGKTYSGSRIQGSKRHRIPDPQHCLSAGLGTDRGRSPRRRLAQLIQLHRSTTLNILHT